MKLWIDQNYHGVVTGSDKIDSRLSEWETANADRVLYLVEIAGEQYNFAEYWPEIVNRYLDSEEEVRILSGSKSDLAEQLLNSSRGYLANLVISLEDIAAQFYAGPDGRSWQLIVDFLEGLEFIQQSALLLENSTFENERFTGMLQELSQAIEAGDNITIADMLTYEWKPWLESLQQQLISN